MTHRRRSSFASILLSFVVAAVTASTIVLTACSSNDARRPGNIDGGTTPAPTLTTVPTAHPTAPGSGTPPLATPVLSPQGANVATCATVQFVEDGGFGSGTWSVSSPDAGGGTISATGLYTAPKQDPIVGDGGVTRSSTPATITYKEAMRGAATATVNYATAFPGAEAIVPIGTNPQATQNVPFEHIFAANRSGSKRVYAVVNGPTSPSKVEIYVSNNGGASFTGPTLYNTGADVNYVTAAVDAANSNILYMVYYAAYPGPAFGTSVRLAVSLDGGMTFPNEYVIADSNSTMPEFGAPDVTSPGPDQVIVAGVGVSANVNGAYAAAFTSNNHGQNIGVQGTVGVRPTSGGQSYATSLKNEGTVHADCGPDQNGNQATVRVFANASGAACMVYRWVGSGCPSPNADVVQCSSNSGSTWSAPLALVTPQSISRDIPTGALSPSGTVAVTWLEKVGTEDEVHVAFSMNGGASFPTRSVYPKATRTRFSGVDTFRPVVQWEAENLWLSQTFDASNQASVVVDKTCDYGTTWSGALQFGKANATDIYQTLGLVPGGTPNAMTLFVAKNTNQLVSITLTK